MRRQKVQAIAEHQNYPTTRKGQINQHFQSSFGINLSRDNETSLRISSKDIPFSIDKSLLKIIFLHISIHFILTITATTTKINNSQQSK